jgi:hypothetical protein
MPLMRAVAPLVAIALAVTWQISVIRPTVLPYNSTEFFRYIILHVRFVGWNVMEVFGVLQAVRLSPGSIAAKRERLCVLAVGGLVVVAQQWELASLRRQVFRNWVPRWPPAGPNRLPT